MNEKCKWKLSNVGNGWKKIIFKRRSWNRGGQFLQPWVNSPVPNILLIADHFLQSREDHRDIKGFWGRASNRRNLLRTFVGQKPSKKHEQSAAPKSVSTWPRPWFNLAPLSGKNCPHRCCCPEECQRSYGEVHLPIIKYVERLKPCLFCPYQRVPNQNWQSIINP